MADSDVETIEISHLDPPPPPPYDWRTAYREELAEHPSIGYAMADQNPVFTLSKRAGLTPAELEVWRWISRGATLTAVAAALGRRPTTIATLRTRAVWRFRALANGHPQAAQPP